ncbi:RimJ/RimL family protein N-acetyltransferase [Bacillus mesophilus]|uniref:GNAT family N-acetyltransferase n=1 Tax=Bacillus mesophilus TaxID=1808955 RepID=A0A6M0QCV7_9BACI|nr:GNAT family N-acetyltransferase [Bacillus mesophilus]MBM7663102.1 RimJ/RimL family protein N-acetyltransferase [Bacillus mesophilus]NEY73579.1 GNAT family N-acetyltransferase [Bacillus mesophilus]
MKIIETERLVLRWVELSDASFILDLLNDPTWLKYIGDKKIRTIEEAENYISFELREMYRKFGFGLYLVELKENKIPLGICGLIKRDSLVDIDIGFAFSSKFQRRGYGFEAASATLQYANETLELKKLVAITTEKNVHSANLLEKIGMKYNSMILLPHAKEELRLFTINLK